MRRGSPVARSALAAVNSGRQSTSCRNTPSTVRASGDARRAANSRSRAFSRPRPYATPEGHTGSHPRHPRQASRCCTSAASSGPISFRSSARISMMRPRGLSDSSPVAR